MPNQYYKMTGKARGDYDSTDDEYMPSLPPHHKGDTHADDSKKGKALSRKHLWEVIQLKRKVKLRLQSLVPV